MLILIDTREKYPFSFPPETAVARRGLASGDYSIEGYENQIAVERKSLEDLVGSLTANRERFFAECKRLQSFAYRCVIVEDCLSKIADEAYRSKAHPASLLGSIASLRVDWRIPVYFEGRRDVAENMCLKFLTRAKKVLDDKARIATEAISFDQGLGI